MVLERLKTIKDKVRYLMLKNDRYKDDVKYIISGYYYTFYEVENLSAKQFLINMANKKYTNADDIARVWRKLLENEPSLRGPNYSERQTKGDKMKTQIFDL